MHTMYNALILARFICAIKYKNCCIGEMHIFLMIRQKDITMLHDLQYLRVPAWRNDCYSAYWKRRKIAPFKHEQKRVSVIMKSSIKNYFSLVMFPEKWFTRVEKEVRNTC